MSYTKKTSGAQQIALQTLRNTRANEHLPIHGVEERGGGVNTGCQFAQFLAHDEHPALEQHAAVT